VSASELELRLTSLRDEIAFPATPDLASRVERELAAGRPPARSWSVRPLAIALAVLVAIVAGVLAFSPGARSAFLEIFRLKGATVERVEELPDVETTGRIPLGREVSREEAERVLGFELLDVGTPDSIHVRDGRVATLVYGSAENPRLILMQLRGSIYEDFVKKTARTGTSVEPVTVRGEPGLFVSGDEHFVMFRNELGLIEDEAMYLAGNTLLWNRGDLLLRLEGDVGRDEALELARSLR
jgi:hypothetical protein